MASASRAQWYPTFPTTHNYSTQPTPLVPQRKDSYKNNPTNTLFSSPRVLPHSQNENFTNWWGSTTTLKPTQQTWQRTQKAKFVSKTPCLGLIQIDSKSNVQGKTQSASLHLTLCHSLTNSPAIGNSLVGTQITLQSNAHQDAEIPYETGIIASTFGFRKLPSLPKERILTSGLLVQYFPSASEWVRPVGDLRSEAQEGFTSHNPSATNCRYECVTVSFALVSCKNGVKAKEEEQLQLHWIKPVRPMDNLRIYSMTSPSKATKGSGNQTSPQRRSGALKEKGPHLEKRGWEEVSLWGVSFLFGDSNLGLFDVC